MLFVAVVCRGAEQPKSGGTNGGWSSFIGPEKEDVIRRALEHAQKGNESYERNTRSSVSRTATSVRTSYKVLVGELTHEAKTPLNYELVDINPVVPELHECVCGMPAPQHYALGIRCIRCAGKITSAQPQSIGETLKR